VRFGFFADAPGFLGTIPNANDADLFALARVGPQGFAEAAGIVSNEAVGRAEDVTR
jgi:hypothetical protein